MSFIGATVGFLVGFLGGQFSLMLVLSGGRHLALRERPKLKFWLGIFNLLIAISGAYIGYQLAS